MPAKQEKLSDALILLTVVVILIANTERVLLTQRQIYARTNIRTGAWCKHGIAEWRSVVVGRIIEDTVREITVDLTHETVGADNAVILNIAAFSADKE